MRVRWWYFRLFGLCAVAATAAYWRQLPGLAAIADLEATAEVLRARTDFFDYPTLLRLSLPGLTPPLLTSLCVVASLLIVVDVAVRWALCVLFVCWGSLVNVGQPFLSFQWDIMLCEAALLSIPYALQRDRDPALWARLLVALVAVKVTFESGIVKLTAGDASWWPDLTALTYHYWTQPLPTWTSVYLDRLPLAIHQASCLLMFVLELGVPLLAFGPPRARVTAAVGMVALQLGLMVAGNYSYFNLLAAVLCVPLFGSASRVGQVPARAPKWGWGLLAVAVCLSAVQFGEQFQVSLPRPLVALADRAQAFKALSSYGVFRVMTKTRPEIIIEGSFDGVHWEPYEFPWKPGRVDRRPSFIAPYQPRLDWQMWFAAMGRCEGWVQSLLRHLLLGTPEVLALLDGNPFAKAPPRYLRSTVWQYRFALPGSSDWWSRSLQGPYCPTVELNEEGRLVRASLPDP